MTKEEAYKSFRTYEKIVEAEVKAGRLTHEQAARYLKEAKANYRNMNYARECDRRGYAH